MKSDQFRTKSLDEMIDRHIGEVGTEKREAFEEELRLDVFSKRKTKTKRPIKTTMESRPKIKIELTVADKAIELIGWLALLIVWVLTITSYSNLPDTIPNHYNVAGQVDGFGNKVTILALQLIATILFVGLTILSKFPHIFNYLTKINKDNALRQYTNATRMLRYIKLALVVVFGLIAYQTIHSTGGLGTWFLPYTLGLIFIPLTFFLVKSLKMKH